MTEENRTTTERTGGARKARMIRDLEPRVPELGRVAIGRKSATNKTKGGHRLPEKLDYFLITGRERDSAGDFKVDLPLMEKLARLQEERTGQAVERDDRKIPKLTEIPIVVLSDEINGSLRAEYAYYSGRKRIADCDGETSTWYFDKAGAKFPKPRIGPCTGEHLKEDENGKTFFKLHATFGFAIVGGADSQRYGGVYKFRTTSIISLEQIVGSLRMIQGLTRGFLANIPLALVVKPMEVSPDGKASTVYVCHCELRAHDLNALQREVIQLAQVSASNSRELLALKSDLERIVNREEDEDEQADVASEFHPERSDEKAPTITITVPAAPSSSTPPPATESAPAAAPPATSTPAAAPPPKAPKPPKPAAAPAPAASAPPPSPPAPVAQAPAATTAPAEPPAPVAAQSDEPEDDPTDDLPF
jgi:hypothetical protein